MYRLLSALLACHYAPRGALGSDLVLNVSSDLANSASRRFTAAGAFNVSGTLAAAQVNTSVLRTLWPAAYAACPSCAFGANLTLSHAPTVTIDTTYGVLARLSDAQASVFGVSAAAPTQRTALFDLSFNGSFGLTVASTAVRSGGVIPVNITVLGLTIVGIDSQVGALTPGQKALLTGAMDLIVSLLIKTIVLPTFAKDFPGLPIPAIKGIALTDVHVDEAVRHLAISVDIAVTPSDVDGGLLAGPVVRPPRQRREEEGPAPRVTPPLPAGFSGPGLEIGVGLSGANKLIAGFLPALVASVESTVIPAFSGEASGVKFSTDATKISGFAIGSVKLANVPGQGLALTLSGLSLAIPSTGFEVSKKIIIKLHCSGHFGGSLSGASVVLPLNITANAAGKPQITAPKSVWNFGALSVSAKMTHNVCKVIKDIASLFTGNIDKLIKSAIEKAIPGEVDSLVGTYGNSILSQLVEVVKVGKDASVDFRLTNNPYTTATSLYFDLLGEFIKPTAE